MFRRTRIVCDFLFVEELREETADQALFEMEILTLITEFCFVCLF